jgi:hypothetical protein
LIFDLLIFDLGKFSLHRIAGIFKKPRIAIKITGVVDIWGLQYDIKLTMGTGEA